jgi:hypothetical protein
MDERISLGLIRKTFNNQKIFQMKPLSILVAFITIMNSVAAQRADTVKYQSKEYYMNKSRSQSTSAWVLLGGGAALATGGLLIGMNNLDWGYENDNDGDYDLGMGMFWVGSAAMLGSIPLFIASARNKGRGLSASASLKMEHSTYLNKSAFVKRSYPALSVRIKLE